MIEAFSIEMFKLHLKYFPILKFRFDFVNVGSANCVCAETIFRAYKKLIGNQSPSQK